MCSIRYVWLSRRLKAAQFKEREEAEVMRERISRRIAAALERSGGWMRVSEHRRTQTLTPKRRRERSEDKSRRRVVRDEEAERISVEALSGRRLLPAEVGEASLLDQ